MSLFRAEIVKVDVQPHPNADRLELVRVKGWQCVAQKGQFKPGDLAVYIPVDAVLSDSLVKSLGIEKNYRSRLRTIKLRGCVSQGLVASLSLLDAAHGPYKEGDDVTEHLGVARYEVPIPVHMSGILRPEHPSFQRYTDVENFKNFPSAFADGDEVVATEKIHGTSLRAADIEGELHVGSHRQSLQDAAENLYWRAARLLDLEHTLRPGEGVFGEIFGHGIQDLTYGKKPGQIEVRVFDLSRDGRYLDFEDFEKACRERGWPMVPVVARGRWAGIKAQAAGESVLAPGQVREGLVVRPLKERWSEGLQGRLILKVLNDDYLARADRTDYH